MLDVKFVRSQFPALDGEWIFFDNAGGSQILNPVLERMRDYLVACNVQHGASYAVSQEAGARLRAATEAMATYVNAADPSEIVMGPSSTQLLRILAGSLVQTLQPGDEIIVTNCDHEANIGPWMELERSGARVKMWRLDPDSYQLRLEDLEQLMTERTRLVAVTHVSNVLGSIQPIAEFARVVHERGAMICVDGVAYAPHRHVDVRDLDVDFYVFSFYKVYGPHHALLYGKREHLLRLPVMNHYFIAPTDVPYKFQPGSVNYELSYGMLGLWDYLDELAARHHPQGLPDDRRERLRFVFDRIARHEEMLAARLLAFLADKPSVRVIGAATPDRDQRVPTISFVVDGKPSDTITIAVDRHKIGIRYGHFYAKRLIDDLGLQAQNGVVRVGMVHYNTLDEVERLVEVLDPLLNA
jgi:cysteine desulfurase family protein (TIGR01976 family)